MPPQYPRVELNQEDITKCNILPFPRGKITEPSVVILWLETVRRQLENISASVFNIKVLPSSSSVATTLTCVMNVQRSISNLRDSINNLRLDNRAIIVQTLLEDQGEGVKPLLSQIEDELIGLDGGAQPQHKRSVGAIRRSFIKLDETLSDLITLLNPPSPPSALDISNEALQIYREIGKLLKGKRRQKMDTVSDAVVKISSAQGERYLNYVQQPLVRLCKHSKWYPPNPLPEETAQCVHLLFSNSDIEISFKLTIIAPIICLITSNQKRAKLFMESDDIRLDYKIILDVWKEWEKL